MYRPPIARLIIIGEAPPPMKFFYFGDSLFFRFQRLAFANLVPEIMERDAGWFLAFFRDLGAWRTDVCPTPQRATKGGTEDVSGCLEGFMRRWERLPRTEDALIVVSPKRLAPHLPHAIRDLVALCVAPPGQWNAHRAAFLRDMEALLAREIGGSELRRAAEDVDADDARLDFEIARACAPHGFDEQELRRLVRGHPREAALWAAWNRVE